MKKRRILIAITIISLIILCIGMTPMFFQNDTFYLITVGQHLLDHGYDQMDHWGWVANVGYSYPHFLYSILLALINNCAGFTGIYLSNIFFFVILSLSSYFVTSKLTKNPYLGSIFAILITMLISVFITARSQILTYTLFLWEIYFIIQLLRTGQKRFIFFLALCSWLVAMVHATIWPFVLALFAPFILEPLIAKILKKHPAPKLHFLNDKFLLQGSPHLKLLLVALLACALVGLLTPNLICYTYFISTALGDSTAYISEHLPLVLASQVAFAVILLLAFAIFAFTKTKIRLSYACLIFALTIMTFFSIRHLALFYVLAIPLLATSVSYLLSTINRSKLNQLKSAFPKYIFGVFCAVMVVFSAICSLGSFASQNQALAYVNPEDYPSDELISYLKTNFNPSELHLFNNYDFGSYLMFNDIPVFIDSRVDPYKSEFNGLDYDLFDDYQTIASGHYEGLFARYDIRHVLDYSDSTLTLILAKDQNYTELYRDDNFVLFERKS